MRRSVPRSRSNATHGGSACSMIRKPHKNERGNAVLIISALSQQVLETVEEAERLLEPPKA